MATSYPSRMRSQCSEVILRVGDGLTEMVMERVAKREVTHIFGQTVH